MGSEMCIRDRLSMSWQLTLITLAVMPLMILLTNFWRVRVREAYRATRLRLSLINGYLNESISGIRVTQSFTREKLNYGHFDDLNHSFFDANVGAAWLTALFFPGVDFIGSLATALVVGVGGWLVLGDTLTAGMLWLSCSMSSVSSTRSATWRSATTLFRQQWQPASASSRCSTCNRIYRMRLAPSRCRESPAALRSTMSAFSTRTVSPSCVTYPWLPSRVNASPSSVRQAQARAQ